MTEFQRKAEASVAEVSSPKMISIFPNPVNNSLKIRMFSPHSENVEIRVVNVLGELEMVLNKDIEEGENVINVNVNQLKSNFYHLSVRGTVINETYNFIKK